MDDYKIMIYDRFCDDVRNLQQVKYGTKTIEYAGLRYNEKEKRWELNVIFKNKTVFNVIEPALISFITGCTYKDE